MNLYASKTYRRRRLERKRRWSRIANAAKEAKRLAAPAEDWLHREYLLTFAVSPDGMTVALKMENGWQRCGSERTIRALLAKAIWRSK